MTLLNNFPHTCTIQRRTRTRDELGGTKDTFATTSSGVSCWVQAARNNEIDEYGKRDIRVTHKVYFTTDPEIDEEYILIIDGENYEVRSKSHPDASAGLGVVYKIMTELDR